ncbi:MAG TPA: hypothetical protein VLA30_09240 [Burkholderiales bacterium]|nr:hypothetical protein [Burkholderiales bacterium]
MRWAGAIAGLAAAVYTTVALAQRDPLATRGGWEVGVQAAGYEYDEPFFATLEGERVGVSGSYTFLGAEQLHSRLDVRYSYAELDYTGSGTLADVPDHILEARAIAGRDYRAGRFVWTPYAGVGFRYLYGDLRGVTSTGAVGYRRISRYFYLPLGVTLRFPVGDGWVFAPQLEYDAFANGKQRSYLGDTGIGYNDVSNRQGRGRGARAQLTFEGPRWGVSFWTHYWKIKDSDIQPIGLGYVGLEPANTTHETGVELRYRF